MPLEYHQFCPIALAAEVVAERWTPLILRELLTGSCRFNEIKRGIPLIPRSLLAKRLESLERAGVLERSVETSAARPRWTLTPAGHELHAVIEALGVWGHRWVQAELREDQLDAGYLMWNISRRLDTGKIPQSLKLVRFDFVDGAPGKTRYWLVFEDAQPDLCLTHPGFDEDLVVESTVRALVEVWRGFVRPQEAIRAGRIKLEGRTALRRAFPSWLLLSHFAHVERPSPPAARPLATGGTRRRRR